MAFSCLSLDEVSTGKFATDEASGDSDESKRNLQVLRHRSPTFNGNRMKPLASRFPRQTSGEATNTILLADNPTVNYTLPLSGS
jgi:hypothetical protein